MRKRDLFYQIAVTLLPNVGPVNTKKLVSLCGHPEAVFNEKPATLAKCRIPKRIIDALASGDVLGRAEKEVAFIEKHRLSTYFYQDKDYPVRLNHCDDSPVMLYGKGKMALDVPKVLSVIGTRNATSCGKEFCETFIAGLVNHQVLIVSGLAYGIDIHAHRASLRNGLQTVGVLAHGLERIYPSSHRETAIEMMENGGLLTDFASYTRFHAGNFPARNRIVAGLSDATVVIESADKGGSLITAEIANSYNREVFAVPGRVNDTYSRGCNGLIKNNQAALLESPEDLIHYLGWESKKKPESIQKKLFEDLTETEWKIIEVLKSKSPVFIDELCLRTDLKSSVAAAVLLDLECKGFIRSLPGSLYGLN